MHRVLFFYNIQKMNKFSNKDFLANNLENKFTDNFSCLKLFELTVFCWYLLFSVNFLLEMK